MADVCFAPTVPGKPPRISPFLVSLALVSGTQWRKPILIIFFVILEAVTHRYPNIWRVELESRKGGKRRLLMCYYNSLISPCGAFIKRSFLPRKRVGFAPPRKNCKNPRGGVFRPQNGVEAVRITFCAFMCWPSPLTKDTLENSLSGNQLIYMLFCPALPLGFSPLPNPVGQMLRPVHLWKVV